MYALIAVGYNIVYGIVKLINMAHGNVFMVAGFIATWGVIGWLLPMPIAYVAGVAVAAVIMVLVDITAYRPLREYKMSAYVAAVAVGFVLQNAVIVFLSPMPLPFPRPEFASRVLHFAGLSLPFISVVATGVGVILFLGLFYLVNRTKIGKAMRAVSESREASQLMGIEPKVVITFAFALSSLYAGIGALVWGLKYPMMEYTSGVMPGLKGFIASVLGGIGHLPGSVIGGFIIGFSEVMFVAFLPRLTIWRDVFAYLLLVLFLLLRPGGIFNVKVIEEKV